MASAAWLDTVGFALNVTGPIFLVVVLGALLKHLGVINDEFVHGASRLVFHVALPALMFFSIIKADIGGVLNPLLIVLASAGTIALFLVLVLVARVVVDEPRDRGVFVQGGFRGNLGVVGLAFCVNAYGNQGLAAAAVLMAVLTVLYNVLSVYILNRSLLDRDVASGWRGVLFGIARNPLIIAIVAALPVAHLQIVFHPVIMRTGEYFIQMTLPLALLCIGATLSLKPHRGSGRVQVAALVAKLVISPLLITGIAYAAGFRQMELGMVFMMTSAPTAAASFVMVRALHGNATLAANIVVVTTLGSLVSVSVGLLLLKELQLI
ncbi:AEC family transporter [Exilibacterium tricleocarpae]|uniref:AEC family transporter n=1 Tax=Exilibacterium tricleocarpae TaxID=2591008 RepID=A0A545T8B3_9GAMM|nr:AEC family transporter [Exilibacterium tricleocarpae]TQV73451.1 AEC family transporter [Exilibacterium tricleocarpae]